MNRDPVFEAFLARQYQEGLALAAESDLLELFPLAYHEPYFADYVQHDLGSAFGDVGLRPSGAARCRACAWIMWCLRARRPS